MERATAYAEAGADAILIHSKDKTLTEITDFLDAWHAAGHDQAARRRADAVPGLHRRRAARQGLLDGDPRQPADARRREGDGGDPRDPRQGAQAGGGRPDASLRWTTSSTSCTPRRRSRRRRRMRRADPGAVDGPVDGAGPGRRRGRARQHHRPADGADPRRPGGACVRRGREPAALRRADQRLRPRRRVAPVRIRAGRHPAQPWRGGSVRIPRCWCRAPTVPCGRCRSSATSWLDRFRLPLGDHDGVDLLMDKVRFADHAKMHGLAGTPHGGAAQPRRRREGGRGALAGRAS